MLRQIETQLMLNYWVAIIIYHSCGCIRVCVFYQRHSIFKERMAGHAQPCDADELDVAVLGAKEQVHVHVLVVDVSNEVRILSEKQKDRSIDV